MKRRVRRLLRQGELRPSVQHFLDHGDTGPARAENPWLEFTLVSHEHELRQALATTDLEQRAAILSKIPAARQLFV